MKGIARILMAGAGVAAVVILYEAYQLRTIMLDNERIFRGH